MKYDTFHNSKLKFVGSSSKILFSLLKIPATVLMKVEDTRVVRFGGREVRTKWVLLFTNILCMQTIYLITKKVNAIRTSVLANSEAKSKSKLKNKHGLSGYLFLDTETSF